MTASSNLIQLGWQGLRYDQESGLYNNHARMYDPRTGRFLTKDPIGFASGETNLYRSRNNNPLSFLDPTGFAAKPAVTNEDANNSDDGVRMLIDSYIRQARGNVTQAWRYAEDDRDKGRTSGQAAVLAEHYLYALGDILDNGKTAVPKYLLLVPGYTSVKAIEQSLDVMIFTNEKSSPASLREIQWGLNGVLGACR